MASLTRLPMGLSTKQRNGNSLANMIKKAGYVVLHVRLIEKLRKTLKIVNYRNSVLWETCSSGEFVCRFKDRHTRRLN